MAETPAVQALRERAAQLVEQGWCQERLAADVEGFKTSPWSARACRWCADGALMRAAGGFNEHYWSAYRAITRRMPKGDLVLFNDRKCRTQAEVVAALRGRPQGQE